MPLTHVEPYTTFPVSLFSLTSHKSLSTLTFHNHCPLPSFPLTHNYPNLTYLTLAYPSNPSIPVRICAHQLMPSINYYMLSSPLINTLTQSSNFTNTVLFFPSFLIPSLSYIAFFPSLSTPYYVISSILFPYLTSYHPLH